MELENISAQLKERVQSHTDSTLSMSPWEIADFLLKCGESLIKYIEFTNKQTKQDSEALLSKNDIEKINSLFRELGDNFFPMAHTTEPLRKLKIVNSYEYENLNNRIENFLSNIVNKNEQNLEASIEMTERLIIDNRRNITEIRNLREEIRTLLNR